MTSPRASAFMDFRKVLTNQYFCSGKASEYKKKIIKAWSGPPLQGAVIIFFLFKKKSSYVILIYRVRVPCALIKQLKQLLSFIFFL